MFIFFFTNLIFWGLNINLMWHFIFSRCVPHEVKSHQPGKVLHGQTALVRPKHLPKGKRGVSHLPKHSVTRKGCLSVRRTSMSSEHASALQPSACLSFATCRFTEKHMHVRTFARYIFKVGRSRGGFYPGSFTASGLAHHSTAHFL